MRTDIKFTPEEQTVLKQLDFISRHYPAKYRHIPDLSLDQILSKCAECFSIEASRLVGKINHQKSHEKVSKLAFLAGMYFFSNMGPDDCRTYANYGGTANSTVWDKLNYERQRNPGIIKFFVTLDKLCPKRLKMLSIANYSMADGVIDFDGASPLTTYQVSRLPVRDPAWFNNGGNRHHLLGFNMNKPGECKFIYFKFTSAEEVLFQMQYRGYRFIKFEDRFNFKGIHPVCDKCVNKNNCINRLRGWYGGSNEDFDCFEEIPNASFKVAIELLYPMKHFQLQ